MMPIDMTGVALAEATNGNRVANRAVVALTIISLAGIAGGIAVAALGASVGAVIAVVSGAVGGIVAISLRMAERSSRDSD